MKSLLGEIVPDAAAGPRGLDGDRLWAVRDPDGRFGVVAAVQRPGRVTTGDASRLV